MAEREITVERVATLVVEYFGTGDGQRKRELERSLHEVRLRPDAVGFAVHMLRRPPQDGGDRTVLYCQWFATSVFDEHVKQYPENWAGLRDTLERLLWEGGTAFSTVVVNKLVKAYVDAGCVGWPEHDQGFLNRLLERVVVPATAAPALLALRVLCEELETNTGNTTRRTGQRHAFVDLRGPLEEGLLRILAGNASVPLQCAALSVLLHYLSWAPLQLCLTQPLLKILFRDLDRGGEQSVLAVSCLVDILGHTLLPPSVQSGLDEIYGQLFGFLMKTASSPDAMCEVPEGVLQKLEEFLRLFFSYHMLRTGIANALQSGDILGVALQFTFLQQTPDDFLRCADIWVTFSDTVAANRESVGNGHIILVKAMERLVQGFIDKALFMQNGNELSTIDDTPRGEDGVTEQKAFITRCQEILVSLIQIVPVVVTDNVVVRMKAYSTELNRLMQMYTNDAQRGEVDGRHVDYVIRDLCTLVTILGALGSHFASHFDECVQAASSHYEFLFEVVRFVHEKGLGGEGSPFREAGRELELEGLKSLRAFTHWLTVYERLARSCGGEESEGDESVQRTFMAMIEATVGVASTIMVSNAHRSVRLVAGQLFRSICLSVRPGFLLSLESVDMLAGRVVEYLGNGTLMDTELLAQFFDAICLAFLLPVRGVPLEQLPWGERKARLGAVARPLVGGIQHAAERLQTEGGSSPLADEYLIQAYACVTKTLESIGKEGSNPKYVFFEVIVKGVLPHISSWS